MSDMTNQQLKDIAKRLKEEKDDIKVLHTEMPLVVTETMALFVKEGEYFLGHGESGVCIKMTDDDLEYMLRTYFNSFVSACEADDEEVQQVLDEELQRKGEST